MDCSSAGNLKLRYVSVRLALMPARADGVSCGTIGTVKGIARTSRDAAKIQRVPGGRRVGKAQLQRRLNEVEKLLAKGAARSEIIELTQLRPRTADDYIRRVREAWHASAQQNRQSVRDQARDRLMLLRDRLLQAGAWGPLVSLEKRIPTLRAFAANVYRPPRTIRAQGCLVRLRLRFRP